jgi:serine/threonine protein kinase
MEVIDAILEFLDARHFPKTAEALKASQQKPKNDKKTSSDAEKLLKVIRSTMDEKENRGNKQGITSDNEAVMESLMTKLITSPKIGQSQAVENSLEKLFEIRAFQKMVSCADQLFFDSDSMNISSRILNKSDSRDEEELPHFGAGNITGDSKSSFPPPKRVARPQDQDELYGVPKPEDSIDNSRISDTFLPSFEQSQEEVDEYEDDDDPGFDAYECNEEDFLIASKELADKFDFPNRAIKRGNKEAVEESIEDSESDMKPKTLLPKTVKFPPSNDSYYPVEYQDGIFDCFDLKVVYDREKTGFEETKDFPIEKDMLIAGRYQVVQYLGSAAFSKAIECVDIHTQEPVCLKIIENNKDYVDQSIDEIKLLKFINYNADADEKNYIRVIDYFYHREHLFIVTELLKDNLYEFYKYNREHEDEVYFTIGRIQKVAYQILKALEYIHSLHLIHCDLKPENILIKSYSKCEVKVIDFGSSCFIHDHLSSYVQSRSYRAPEVILGCKYDYRVDIWSLGCILAELWTGNVLFQNETVQGLLSRVIGIVGPMPEYIFEKGRLIHNFFTREKLLYQEASEESKPDNDQLTEDMAELIKKHKRSKKRVQIMVPKRSNLKARLKTDDAYFIDFIRNLLNLDYHKRPTAREALQHPFITKCKYSDGLP